MYTGQGQGTVQVGKNREVTYSQHLNKKNGEVTSSLHPEE